MSEGVLFMDGCDHYETADIGGKWHKIFYAPTVASSTPRHAGQYLNLGPASTPPGVAWRLPSASNTIVEGFAIRCVSFGISAGQHRGFRLMRNSVEQATVMINQDGSISVKRGSYDGTVLGTSPVGAIRPNVWQHLEFKIEVGNSGNYEVRVDNTTVLESASGGEDTQATADAGADEIRLYGDSVNGGEKEIDDFFLADDDFRGDRAVITIYPNGVGANSDWIPSSSGVDNYAEVDEAPAIDDDSTYVSSGTPTDTDTYACESAPSIGTTAVDAVAVNICARKDDAGARTIRPIIRMGSSDYAGTSAGMLINYTIKQEVWNNPPDAPSQAWTDSDVNGAEFGFELTA
jgi:hypothetical protein